MSATERLRAMLDERGVEYETDDAQVSDTEWYYVTKLRDGYRDRWIYEEPPDCDLLVSYQYDLGAEDAIAATLGDADATDARQGDAWTCHDMGGCRWFRCSACGFGIEDMYVNEEDGYPPEDQPRYCPNCGRLVVEVDE